MVMNSAGVMEFSLQKDDIFLEGKLVKDSL